jgi:hypothetical protein
LEYQHKGRHKMLKTVDQEAELIFGMVMKLGQSDYSQMTKSAIWAECESNTKIRNLAVQYLAGSSQSATLNLYKLHTAVMEVFFTDPITGKLVINGKLVF